MSKRDKWTLYSAALLAVLVIVSALIAYLRPDAGSLILFICIVLAAMLSVVVVYLTKVRKGKHEQLLNTEYEQRYTMIRDAVAASQLSAGTKSEIRADVLDLLLSAQEAGKPAAEAVGSAEVFAADILRAYSRPGYSLVLGLIGSLISFAAIILGIYGFSWLEEPGGSFFSIGVGIDMLVFIALVAWIVIPLTRRFALSRNVWAFSIPVASGVAFILITMGLRAWFINAEWVRAFLDETVRLIPNLYAFAAYVLAVPALLLAKVWLRKRMLRLKTD